MTNDQEKRESSSEDATSNLGTGKESNAETTPEGNTPIEKPAGVEEGQGPGKTVIGPIGITLLLLYLTSFTGFFLWGLVQIWPGLTAIPPVNSNVPSQAPQSVQSESITEGRVRSPASALPNEGRETLSPIGTNEDRSSGTGRMGTPSDQPQETGSEEIPPVGENEKNREAPIKLYGVFLISGKETLLLVAVALAGTAGAMVHTLRSFYWYVGSRDLRRSWIPLYLLRPFVGTTLALVFYLVIRGGFFSPSAESGAVSPLGFTALASLVGMFSEQAVLKLKQVADTVFTKPPPGSNSKAQEANE